MARRKVLKLEAFPNTFVKDVVNNEVIFGKYEEAYMFDNTCMRGSIKGLDYYEIQRNYNNSHDNKLKDISASDVMDESDRVTYICDLKEMQVVKNSLGQMDNLKLVIAAHINKVDGNTAIMTYKVWMFQDKADYMCEVFDDYKKAVARYNEVAAEYCSNFGKYADIKK